MIIYYLQYLVQITMSHDSGNIPINYPTIEPINDSSHAEVIELTDDMDKNRSNIYDKIFDKIIDYSAYYIDYLHIIDEKYNKTLIKGITLGGLFGFIITREKLIDYYSAELVEKKVLSSAGYDGILIDTKVITQYVIKSMPDKSYNYKQFKSITIDKIVKACIKYACGTSLLLSSWWYMRYGNNKDIKTSLVIVNGVMIYTIYQLNTDFSVMQFSLFNDSDKKLTKEISNKMDKLNSKIDKLSSKIDNKINNKYTGIKK